MVCHFPELMGRIKTALVKRITKELIKAHGSQFTTNFEQNKAVLNEVSNMPSKKIRNVVAGYTTRLKQEEQA
jgi:small subunit ribosomal protein S17e